MSDDELRHCEFQDCRQNCHIFCSYLKVFLCADHALEQRLQPLQPITLSAGSNSNPTKEVSFNASSSNESEPELNAVNEIKVGTSNHRAAKISYLTYLDQFDEDEDSDSTFLREETSDSSSSSNESDNYGDSDIQEELSQLHDESINKAKVSWDALLKPLQGNYRFK